MRRNDLIHEPWTDYKLIDSGENKKLERFGKILLIRPETQALWSSKNKPDWETANGEFFMEGSKGTWKKKNLPESWTVSWNDMVLMLKPTSFKHIGVFPEQEPNWNWIEEKIKASPNPKVLNLFGYTGAASIVAALAGANVTHVDASKQSNTWARENAMLSKVPDGGIRYITDDAIKFAERDGRRGVIYDGIILDPPAFGRGPKGEVWHIEEHLPLLLKSLAKIFSDKPGAFFLLNGYAAGFSANSFRQLVQDFFDAEDGEYGELNLKESRTQRILPSGIYVRYNR